MSVTLRKIVQASKRAKVITGERVVRGRCIDLGIEYSQMQLAAVHVYTSSPFVQRSIPEHTFELRGAGVRTFASVPTVLQSRSDAKIGAPVVGPVAVPVIDFNQRIDEAENEAVHQNVPVMPPHPCNCVPIAGGAPRVGTQQRHVCAINQCSLSASQRKDDHFEHLFWGIRNSRHSDNLAGRTCQCQ